MYDGLEENFRFLALEVADQARSTALFLRRPSRLLFEKVVTRDDYIDNLKNVVENKCFSRIHLEAPGAKRTVDRIRSLQIIAGNLERIADFCVNVVRQMSYLSDTAFLNRFDHQRMMEAILAGLDLVHESRDRDDLSAALAICRGEHLLDRLYKENFDRIMDMLRTGREVENLITALFIFRYLERIGDSLLNIGEAMIFAIIGEKIKIEQFQALQQSLSKSGFAGSISEIDFQSIWGTRSGCRIGRVGGKDQPQDPVHGSIFKEGALAKVRREKESIESWESVYPGIGPKIFSYHEEGDKASLLVQFLPGCTMEEILLTAEPEQVRRIRSLLEQTLSEIWDETARPGPQATDYMAQLAGRLDSVRLVHKDLERPAVLLNRTPAASTRALIAACADLEKRLPAPETVIIHGDFNANNIVYDHGRERVHFIDLHRSRRADPVQDISVFLVSHFRLPVFEPALRSRINQAVRDFLEFALEWAAERADQTIQARLALALARSLYTSTRFELNREFSRDMFLRAHYLLEKLAAWTGRPEDFRLPQDVLVA